MFDKNGTALAVGQMVEINGEVWQVAAAKIGGDIVLDERAGLIRIMRVNGKFGGRNNWFVDPARLVVIK